MTSQSDDTAHPGHSGRRAIHATAVAVGDAGVLIRGRSGAGKSSLALALIDLGEILGPHTRLVGDDRVFVTARAGSLVVEPHPAILGRIERRGFGITTVPHQPTAPVRLVVDFVDTDGACDIPPRMPDGGDLSTSLVGIALPRIALRTGIGSWDAALEVVRTLRDMKSPK